MFKFIITVTLFLQLMLQTECLYSGETCVAEGRGGTCLPLLECRHLVNEIRKAGSPMPHFMATRLQKLTCGFNSNQPMVCCVSSSDTVKPNREQKPVQTDDSLNNVDPFTKATIIDKSGPISVEDHPNLSLLPLNCGNFESDRIWGGNQTRLYEMPWMVLLSYNSVDGPMLSCGGSLISEWYVLTAAHCVTFLGTRLTLQGVILGEHDVRQDPDCEMSDGKKYCAPRVKFVKIGSVEAHSGYSPQSMADDIALIRLAEPANFALSNMKPLCLPITPELQAEPLDGLNTIVAGWGLTEHRMQSPVLLSVELPIMSRKKCQAIFKGTPVIKKSQLCAGGVKDRDSCSGDSGGPLMYPGKLGNLGVRYIQRAIVSFGSKRCGISGFPGVYTNVAYYMDWILDHMHS